MAERPSGARPLVVIPARFSASASALRHRAEVLSANLVRSVYDAGGEPLVIHPDAFAAADARDAPNAPNAPDAAGVTVDDGLVAAVRSRLWMADAVLLPGGGDMSARWSGQEPHQTLYDVDEEQDAFDIAVATWALADRVPLLAICRGNQVVNVARGGNLVQDMTEAMGKDHRHLVHDITLDADSPLREVVADDTFSISCHHHQCLGVLGAGLTPAAHATDGTIEAVTLAGHDGWYLGVQWHPEDSADRDPLQARVFRALVNAAR